jgi:3-mercaptopyruvate sulfurtransferase SseA
VALQLRRYGIRNVHPLLGGYYDWKELGYPLEDVLPEDGSGEELNAIASDGAA